MLIILFVFFLAGIMFPPFVLTEDGYESQWGVNYLGPFLLTHLLFPLIRTASFDSECRIVNVSSCAHKICTDIDYPNLNKKYVFFIFCYSIFTVNFLCFYYLIFNNLL